MSKKPVRTKLKSSLIKTSFDLPASLKTSFKLKAVADGTDMKYVIVKLIDAYIKGKIKLDEI